MKLILQNKISSTKTIMNKKPSHKNPSESYVKPVKDKENNLNIQNVNTFSKVEPKKTLKNRKTSKNEKKKKLKSKPIQKFKNVESKIKHLIYEDKKSPKLSLKNEKVLEQIKCK